MSDWRDHAACREHPSVSFFVGDGEPGKKAAARAKAICAACPVRDDCLTDAIDTDEAFGIRGGMTPTERHQERRRRLGVEPGERRKPGPPLLEDRDPELVAYVHALHAEGVSQYQIRRETGLAVATLRRLIRAEA